MNKIIFRLCLFGAILAIVVGTLLHFVYDRSGNNLIVGFFAPVNESPWEHMKLAFVPILLFGIIDWFYLKGKATNYLLALSVQLFTPIIFILIFFYLYTSIFGHPILFLDISSFIIGVVFAKWLGYKILIKDRDFSYSDIICGILILGLTFFFIIATLNPPRLNPFLDPVTNTYGVHQLK